MSDHITKTLALLMDEMGKFRADMESVDITAARIGANTSRMIRMVLAILGGLSLYLAYLVFSMSSHLAVMLGHLDNMYSQFGLMSDDMQLISRSVKNMGGNITGMSLIAENMTVMRKDLVDMVRTGEVINYDMARMESSTAAMGVNTREMAFRFYNLGGAVNRIGYDVNQIGKPFP